MYMERFSTNASISTMGPDDSRLYKDQTFDADDSADFGPVFAEQMQVKFCAKGSSSTSSPKDTRSYEPNHL